MKIAIIAGEASGDMLGAGLIRGLKARFPSANFEGIGGPLMEAEGLKSIVPMERLAVMGLVEVLGRLPELLLLRRRLTKRWLNEKPDVFIGIDAPDFNIGLEYKLRSAGIKTAHYVSPSVWAWREKRVFKIAKAVDLMLTLFPFEAKFYHQHQVPVKFVGHHLADSIAFEPNTVAARERLDIGHSGPIICVMPGSRSGEVGRIGPIFLAAAEQVLIKRPDAFFIIPAVNHERRQQLEQQLAECKTTLPVKIIVGQSQLCMEASNAILLASGTATLEATLLKKPMVVSYRLSAMTYFIAKRMVKQPYVSLPNLLAGRELVPELIQDEATAENLADALLVRLDESEDMQKLNDSFHRIHRSLKCDANSVAAEAIAELLTA